MATSINVRFDNEKEEQLKQIVSDLKANAPTGVEVNNSTVIRGAVDSLLKEFEEEKKGTRKVVFNLKDLSEKELNYLFTTVLQDFNEYQKTICKIENEDSSFKDNDPRESKMQLLQKLLFDMMCQFKLEILKEMTKRV